MWYDNTDGTEVTVTLYQYGLWGIKTALDDFSVAGNSADYMVVDGGFLGDSATYYVLIESADGGAISGTLRVNQRTTAT